MFKITNKLLPTKTANLLSNCLNAYLNVYSASTHIMNNFLFKKEKTISNKYNWISNLSTSYLLIKKIQSY
jgi:hypothetical protein